MAMVKAKIIERIVNDGVCLRSPVDDISNDEAGCSRDEIVAILEVSLKNATPEERVRTCEDFSHLQVACCDTCHTFYPQYEMALIDIESGGHAWICCSLDRALNPHDQAERERSPEWQAIMKMLDGDVVDLERLLQQRLSD